LFEQTAGKQTCLRVNNKPSFAGSRLITVVPLSSERQLRSRAWIDDNRRKVDKMSGGRLAYVYLPNTSYAGYVNFNRYYFAQQNKQGAIIDERFNGGGSAADYFVDLNMPVQVGMRCPIISASARSAPWLENGPGADWSVTTAAAT
jgi:tricorn protease